MTTEHPPQPQPGEIFAGTYELVERIGRGGFGAVFRARRTEFGDEVAVKIFLRRGSDPDAAARVFHREALLASTLRHPNTVTPLDYGRSDDGVAYIVMELLRGKTLRDEIRSTLGLSPERSLDLTLDVLSSLVEAHDRGIVHGDIKPANIFLPEDTAHARILDFGVARLVGDDLGEGEVAGTPAYIAPELALGAVPTRAADIYSLGIVTYEMLSGQLPFRGRNAEECLRMHVYEPFPALPASLRDTPAARFVHRATVKEPDARPTASEMLAELEMASHTTTNRIRVIKLTGESGTLRHRTAPPAGDTEEATDTLPASELRTVPFRTAPPGVSPSSHGGVDFVGRSEELSALSDDVCALVRHGGGLVLLSGATGIGKKRLTRELALRLRDALGAAIVTVDCAASEDDGIALIREILERLRRAAEDRELDSDRRLNDLIQQLAPPEETGLEAGRGPRDIRLQLPRAARIIAGLSGSMPIVLVARELQHADELVSSFFSTIRDVLQSEIASLALVATISTDQPASAPHAIEMLRAARSGESAALREHAVRPLNEDEIDAILEAVGPVGPTVRELLQAESGGNPGHLLDLLYHGVETGLLRRRHGRVVPVLGAKLEKLRLGHNPEELAFRRFQSMLVDDELRRVLSAVSFLGDSTGRDVVEELFEQLAQLGRLEGELPWELIRIATDRNLLAEEQTGGRRIVRFPQPLVAEWLRESTPPEEKPAFCRAAAEALMARRARGFPAWRRAAQLYGDGGDPRRALACALHAASLAESQGDLASAETLYSTAMLYNAGEPDERFVRVEARIQLGLARTKASRGAVGAAEEILRRVLEDAESRGDRKTILDCRIDRAENALARSALSLAEEQVQRILDDPTAGDEPELVARAILLRGRVQIARSAMRDALGDFVQAERAAAALSLSYLRAHARLGIARCQLHEGKFERAERLLKEIIEYFRQKRYIDPLIESLVEYGNLLAARDGDSDTAGEVFSHAQRLAEDYGRSLFFADILLGEGKTLIMDGRTDAGTLLLLRALERYRALGSARGQAETLLVLAECALDRGQTAAVRNYASEAVDCFDAIDNPVGAARGELLIARAAARRSASEEALRYVRRSEHKLRSAGATRELPGALVLVAQVLADRGQLDRAIETLSESRALAESLGDADLAEKATALLASYSTPE